MTVHSHTADWADAVHTLFTTQRVELIVAAGELVDDDQITLAIDADHDRVRAERAESLRQRAAANVARLVAAAAKRRGPKPPALPAPDEPADEEAEDEGGLRDQAPDRGRKRAE